MSAELKLFLLAENFHFGSLVYKFYRCNMTTKS